MPRPILVIGATGMFGRRLAQHLANRPILDPEGREHPLVFTSRDAARSKALAAELGRGTGIALATGPDLPNALARIAPFAVVDCSGPFQNLDHSTARAAIEAGAHAVDLADARDYVGGYAKALDRTARANGVSAIGGASSTPTLSGLFARELTADWTHVRSLDFAIVPGGAGDVGRAVVDGVLSYAGRPVPMRRGGHLSSKTGWGEGRTMHVAELGKRRVATVETSDAERLEADDITFRAGLETRLEQYGLEALAFLRRRFPGLPIERLARPLASVRRFTRHMGGDVGGMVLNAKGLDADGRPIERSLTLIARDGHGPNVPILPAAAALRKLARGAAPPGARIGDEVLNLSEIETEMAPYAISLAFSP